MKITAYGGAGEIGGNKILLEAGKTRVFLDFGIPFDRGAGIYSGFDYLEPREKLGLRDYFEFGMMPEIQGVYSRDALYYTDMKYKKPSIDAILISHIHSDHIGDVAYADSDIPVYLGHGANKLNEAFNTIYPSFKTDAGENIVEMKTGKKFKIKDITVTPVHMDHSIPGAYGFIIETPEGTIAYTGDFRLHGFRPDMTEDFIKMAGKAKVDVLICEGTRVKNNRDMIFKKKMTEGDVENEMADTIKKTDGITFVQFSFRNVDRVRSLYNAAVKAGKVLIANPGFVYTIDNARELIDDLPKTKDNKNLLVFNKNCDIPDDEKRIYNYQKPYLDKCIDYKWVKKNIGDVVMFVSASELSQMVDIQPKSGTFIYSMSEHYIEGEDNEEYKECLDNWLNHFGIKLAQIHCSGHADEAGVRKMIDGVNADTVIPVHTENAEAFKGFCEKVILPEKGKTIVL